MGVDDIRKRLADMTADISNVQTAITETSEASDSLTQKIAGLASANTKAGSVWSVIGRMSSGSGLYDIQNKTRSIAFLFKVKQNFDKDRIKSENKINEILSNGIKRREKLLTITKLTNINKIKALTKGKLLNDDTLKLQMKQFGFVEAVTKEVDRANKALKQSVLSEASTLDSREYGKREDKSDLFKKLGGVASGNLADRQDLAVGVDSKTDELNEQLKNLKKLRLGEYKETLIKERLEGKLQDNYNKKERAKELKASLAREKNVKIEGDITQSMNQAKLDLIKEEQRLVDNAVAKVEYNKEILEDMRDAHNEASIALRNSEKAKYGVVDTQLKKELSFAEREMNKALRAVVSADRFEKNKRKDLKKIDDEHKELLAQMIESDKVLETRKALQAQKIAEIETKLLDNKELSLAAEDKIKDDLSTQKEIQAAINTELKQSEDLIKAYNSELNILIENAEDSGLVIVDKDEGGFKIDDDSGEIETGTGVVTETSKGKKDKPKFVNPREKRKFFSTDDGIGKREKLLNFTGFGKQTDKKQGGLFSKVYGKEAEDMTLRNSEEGTKPDSVKLFKTIGDKLGLDKRKLSNIFKFAKVGFMVFGKVLLFVSLLGMLVFMLKQLGVFEKISDMYDKFVDSGLLADTIHHFTKVFGGIFDMIMGTFELLGALFDGDLGGAGDSLSKIGLGLWSVVSGSIGLMYTGTVTLIRIILGGIISSAVSRITRNIKLIKDEGWVGLLKVGQNLLTWAFKRLLMVAIATAVGAAIGFFFGGPPGAMLGAKAGGIVGGLASAMETGGVTHKAGNYLVGEKGPEIISLPGNVKVHNNNDTKRMMGQTVNVTVQGRLGASDQELNEIARKIGQKVNLEMNRYSNSGYRG